MSFQFQFVQNSVEINVFFLDSLSDKYQRLFNSINLSSSNGSTSTSGNDRNIIFEIFFYNKLLRLECTNDTYKAVLERNTDLERENERIQRLNTTLQSRVYDVSLRVCEQKSICIHDQKNNFCFSLRI